MITTTEDILRWGRMRRIAAEAQQALAREQQAATRARNYRKLADMRRKIAAAERRWNPLLTAEIRRLAKVQERDAEARQEASARVWAALDAQRASVGLDVHSGYRGEISRSVR